MEIIAWVKLIATGMVAVCAGWAVIAWPGGRGR
jgi:hypothetical protein